VRYIGDMSSPNFATPRKAKINFSKAKLKLKLQRKKIKSLQTTVRRLRKKLSSLEALFKHLKKNNMISDQAHDDILVLNTFISLYLKLLEYKIYSINL